MRSLRAGDGRCVAILARICAFFLAPALLIACNPASGVLRPEASRIIEGVPFFPQEMYQCGPASLASVLNYWGVRISPEEVAREVYSEAARGTLDMDMVFYARRRGLRARQYEGSLEDIKRNIDSGRPLIVLVDYGFSVYQRNHFMVVLGYGENGIIVNSGRDHRKFLALKKYLPSWKRTKFWTMEITP